LFSFMGVWPCITGILLLSSASSERLPALPFMLCSFFGGMFALTPYFLFFRPRTGDNNNNPNDYIRRILRSKQVVGFLLVASIILGVYGISKGNLALFWRAIETKPFMTAMFCDFVAFSIAGYHLIQAEDEQSRLFGIVPVYGPLLYLWASALRKEQSKSA